MRKTFLLLITLMLGIVYASAQEAIFDRANKHENETTTANEWNNDSYDNGQWQDDSGYVDYSGQNGYDDSYGSQW